MQGADLIVEVEDGVCWLFINRPEKMNSITMATLGEIADELRRFESDTNVRAMVIAGVGGRAFSTGVDLSTMADGSSFFDMHQARSALGDLFGQMWRYPKPIVAMVDGYALAGGFGLAAACDFIIASQDSKFGLPEVNVGVWPFLITVPLLRAINPRVLLELMMTGRRIDASEALRIGVANWVVPRTDLEEATRSHLKELTSKSSAVLALGKASFYRAMEMDSSAALGYLQSMLSLVTQLEDAREGLDAFAQKRAPVWRHR